MEDETKISVVEKFAVWLDLSLKLGGVLLVYHCLALKQGWFTPFKSVEMAAIEANQTDMSYAMMAVQEDVLELHKKVKK